ncbi:response regulator [Starkeya sp. ORNL1]|uniref:response regulator transcription factor n=1 Tax=Starkeya sp. ORNL1 TaxID=2709380 RepID=UPI0014646753|nr:response regulator [Starkeya sp. ORNL1]QJP13221.1 response regulator [Starkeya sp. ORNL1]
MATARVVIIDDDDSMRKALQRLLAAAGFQPVAYGSSEAFLEDSADSRSSCIVCDQNLPAMPGLELLQLIRKRQEEIPFILITAFDSPGLGARALSDGAIAYLTKPFAGFELIEAIREAIALSGKSRRPSAQ